MTEKSEHVIRREHFVAGVETERERIIALLEVEASELEGHDCADDCKIRAQELRLGIALIKGENE